MTAREKFTEVPDVPQAVEAEQSVLGGLMLDNNAIDRIGELRSEHFYRHDHRTIFEAIQKLTLNGRTADMLTVFENMQASGKAEATGGLEYLNKLVGSTPGASNIARYAEIVVDRWKLRGLLAAANEVRSLALDTKGREVSEIIGLAQAKLEPLAESRSFEPKFIGQLLTPVVEEIDSQYHGVLPTTTATGLRDLDAKLDGGMNGGELVVVAGRPSMGKTAFAMGIATHVAKQSGTVLVFSMEMQSRQLVQRSLARTGGIAMSHVKNGHKMTDGDWPRLTNAVADLVDLPILLDESPGLTLAEIVSRSRAAKRRHGLSLIVVDYIGLMTGGDGDNRTQQVGSYSRGLKGLAKQLDVPVMALSQLNRGVDNRMNRRPTMSDLRDSGEIEQDADVILFLYRDEVYDENSPDAGKAEVIVSKHRNGETGAVHLAFVGEHARFADLPPGYRPATRSKPRFGGIDD